MTHHTDTDRADFEAWLAPEYSREKWQTGEYTDDTVFSMFAAWQAARSAPAVTVPQDAATHNKNLNGFIEFANQIDFAKPRSARLYRKFILETRDAILGLLKAHLEVNRIASAPQPPEAAPVELPEPVYTMRVRGRMHDYTPTLSAFDLADGEHELYTEQQVIGLLKSVGVAVKP